MPLALEDHWVWDFWLADDGRQRHLFHLQAPRSLGDPEQRHWHATIGHATSQDLREWDHHGTALRPGPAGAWDDLALWTGSIARSDDLGWVMLYTGCSTREKGLVQRIGIATSPDLHTWRKHPDNPVIEADPRWYEQLDLDRWHDQAWRDPWVLRHPDDGTWHALITARVPDAPTEEAGVIGHASSRDLVDWQVHPPVTGPSGLGQLEVPQVVTADGRNWMVYSHHPFDMPVSRRAARARSGSHAVPMEGLLGPCDFTDPLPIGSPGSYSNKVTHDVDGAAVTLGFVLREGPDHLTIADPQPLAPLDLHWPGMPSTGEQAAPIGWQ